MTPESPAELQSIRGLHLWIASILLLSIGLLVWFSHFNNGFHYQDFDIIVNNRPVHQISNFGLFFSSPTAFSLQPEFADYKPLLLTFFAFDYKFASNNPGFYHLDGFAWFAILTFSLYRLFRLLPGARREVALLAAAVFSIHPVIAETLNYISQRGQILAATGVSLALVLWIFWPRRMPRRLPLDLNRVPQTWWQDQVRRHGYQADALYRRFIRLPIPFYLIPLIPALLCDPSAAIFAPLLAIYIAIYERGRDWLRVVPAAAICGIYWIAQTIVVLRFSPLFRIPSLTWYLGQPWQILRYLFRFFIPVHVPAFSEANDFGWILIAAGFAGLAGLIRAAWWAARQERLRGIGFGLWWFLLALAPTILVPQRTMESYPRMFMAAAGLSLAFASALFVLFENLWARSLSPDRRWGLVAGASALVCAVLALLGFLTWQRNQVWESEETLWTDVTETSPRLALGYIGLGNFFLDDHQDGVGTDNIRKAAKLTENNAPIELKLALAFDRVNLDVDTELHFRRSIAAEPRYSAAYSYFGQWLLGHQRRDEAMVNAQKALSLNSADLISRHTLLDIYSDLSDWNQVAKLAKEALALDPDDPAGQRSLVVATASFDKIRRAEEAVKDAPRVDDYLSLSVLYFHNRRFEDCIKAAQNALALRPNLAEAWANMAMAYHTLGKDDDAINALRQVIRLRPDMSFAKTDLEILLENKAEAERQGLNSK